MCARASVFKWSLEPLNRKRWGKEGVDVGLSITSFLLSCIASKKHLSPQVSLWKVKICYWIHIELIFQMKHDFCSTQCLAYNFESHNQVSSLKYFDCILKKRAHYCAWLCYYFAWLDINFHLSCTWWIFIWKITGMFWIRLWFGLFIFEGSASSIKTFLDCADTNRLGENDGARFGLFDSFSMANGFASGK